MSKERSDFNSPQPFNFQGSPGPDNDVRFLSANEAVELCKDPRFRKALDIVHKQSAKDFPELFKDKPMGIHKVVQYQAKKNMLTDIHAKVNQKVIDLSMKKKGLK